MNILYIAFSTIKRNFRDKRSMFRSILMPVLMIMILGAALNSAFQVQKVDKFDICYYSEDKGEVAEEFNKFINSQDIKDILNVKTVDSIEEGKKLVNEKRAVSLIAVPKDYSEKVKNGEKAIIQIYNPNNRDYKNDIVENIIDVYNSAGNSVMAAAKLNTEMAGYTRYSSVEENVISTEGKAPRAIDYYGVAMLVLAIMGSAGFAADMVSEDYFENVGLRIKATPIKSYEKLIGKILGCVADIFIKGIIVVAFSKLVYGVNWGSNFGMIAIIIISAAVFATSLGMFVTMAIGSGSKAASLLNMLNIFFTFTGGGYVVIISQDVHESAFMHLSPNFYPQTALFNVIYSNNYRTAIQFFNTFGYISMLWIAAGVLCVGFILLERRRVK